MSTSTKKNLRDILRQLGLSEEGEREREVAEAEAPEEYEPAPKKREAVRPRPPEPPPVRPAKGGKSAEEGEEEEVLISDSPPQVAEQAAEAPKKRPERAAPAPPTSPLASGTFDIFKLLDDPDISDDERRAIISVAWKKFGPREEFLRYMSLLTQDQVAALLRHIADHPQCEAARILAERLLEYMAHGGVH